MSGDGDAGHFIWFLNGALGNRQARASGGGRRSNGSRQAGNWAQAAIQTEFSE